MENSNENPKRFKIVSGEFYATDEKETIKMPPEKAIKIGASSIILNGEMTIDLESNTIIKDDDGTTKARVSNKYPKILVSKNLDKEQSKKAVEKLMKEKNITTLKAVVDDSKTENQDKKASEIEH